MRQGRLNFIKSDEISGTAVCLTALNVASCQKKKVKDGVH